MTRRRTLLVVIGLVALFVVLRLPTLFVPPSSADEGLYVDIGWSITHGAVLYRDAWDNKPPGMYWLSALVNLGSPSVFRMQVVLAIVVAAGATLALLFGMRLRSAATGAAAALLFLLLTAIPDFSGDQLNSEIVAAIPVAVAMLLLLAPSRLRVARAALAGAMVAIACLFKLQFVADDVVVVTTPLVLWFAADERFTRVPVRHMVAVVAGGLATAAAACVALAATGALGPLIDTVFKADSGYLSHFQTGTALTTPTASTSVMFVVRVGSILVLGTILVALLCRRKARTAALLAWWLTWDLAAIMLDARGLSHYAQQMAIPLCVTAAVAGRDVLARLRFRCVARAAVAVACAAGVWGVDLAAQYVPPLTGTLAAGGPPPPAPALGIVSTLRYYKLGWSHVLGTVSQSTYDRSFIDGNYPLNLAMAQLIDTHTTSADHVCVWALATPWTFALAQRLSSTRFLWMETAYFVYPNSENVAEAEVMAQPPALLIGPPSLPARLLTFLAARGYSRVHDWRPGIDYWLAPRGA